MKGIGGKAKWCRSGSKLARGENESDGANEKNSKMYECVWKEKIRDKGRDNSNMVRVDGALRLGTRPVTGPDVEM